MNGSLANLAWAAVRVTFGAGMAFFHGYSKMFEGKALGLSRAVAEMGFPAPEAFAWIAAGFEFFGGLLVALGLATRYAAAGVCCVMLVAIYNHLPDGIVKMELAILYLAVMALAVVLGGGQYALDRFIKLRMPVGVRSHISRNAP